MNDFGLTAGEAFRMLQEPVAAAIGAIDTLEERSVPFSRESAGVRTARWRERGGVAKRQGRGLQNPDSPVRIRAPPPTPSPCSSLRGSEKRAAALWLLGCVVPGEGFAPSRAFPPTGF